MKRMKLIGLSLLAIFVLGAFAATTALAEEGFLPTQKEGNALGGKSVLETTGGGNITCTKLEASTIKFENAKKETSDKHGDGTLKWVGCKAFGLVPVNSEGDPAETILAPLLFLVCLDAKNGATLVDNFGVAGELDTALHLIVPATNTKIEVTGTALGAILTSGKAKLWSMEFLGAKGVQTITECLEGTNKKTHTLKSKENAEPAQAASEKVESGLLQFPAEVELMDS
jgi:hypothetical protein